MTQAASAIPAAESAARDLLGAAPAPADASQASAPRRLQPVDGDAVSSAPPAGRGKKRLLLHAGTVSPLDVLRSFRIAHRIPGRVRLRPAAGIYPADMVLFALETLFPDTEIEVSARTGSVLIHYGADSPAAVFFETALPKPPSRSPNRLLRTVEAGSKVEVDRIVPNPLPGKVRSYFYPRIAVFATAVLRSIPYIVNGIRMLLRGKLNLEVLDGAALLVCLLQRDFRSLSSITFFFALGDYLAEWTRKKSRANLEDSLSLNIDQVWVQRGELEQQIPFADLVVGDHVIVRMGAALPVDGLVVEGEGLVNQSTMTGESLAVRKAAGTTVYAGTILEEGELVIQATRIGSETRIHSILRTIEESETAKASVQGRYERMADAIVPFNFLLSGAVYAATRSPMRAGSVLLVDYSCAIRLTTPLCIFTAMSEAAQRGVLIKGGKFLEAVSEADVVVFDKTGTLTRSEPSLVEVIPFGGRKRQSVLRLAACLEEHFAHPVGEAVVRASDAEGLQHREEHTKVEYIVAHGIASRWRDQRVLIGSRHFVVEDEKVRISPEQEVIVTEQSALGRSVLYLGIDGELAGLLLIEDAIREDAAEMVTKLKADGVRRVIMLTGDGEQTAAAIAARAGIVEYRAEMLPEEKAAFIRDLRKQGHIVAMVGDGVNDSPALSAANVGIAMAQGADIAREVADIVLVDGELSGLLLARRISRLALARIHGSFRSSLLWNSLFLVGGLLGIVRPGLSAFMHNATTAALAVSSVRPLLPMSEPGQPGQIP